MKELLATLTLLIVVLISGCKENDYVATVGVCPLVVSTIPANGAVKVPLNQVVSATFNEKMNPATITSSTFLVIDATKSAELKAAIVVPGTITYSGMTASFTPSSPLAQNTTYTGRITTAVKDLMGNALQTDYVWSFSTDAAPTVLSNPINNAVDVPLNKIIVATFSAPMDSLSFKTTGSTFIVRQGTTVVPGKLVFSGTTVSFVPTGDLAPFTVYTGTITTAAKNVTGTAITADYVWNFTTIPQLTILSNPVAGGTTSGAGVFNQGSSVTVLAAPKPGYSFVNWTVGTTVVSTAASYQFVMAGNKTLNANFALSTITLDVTGVNGTVSKSPDLTNYNLNAVVLVTAVANSGYKFSSWSGDASGTVNPLTVTMNTSKKITANFTLSSTGSTPVVDLQSAGRFGILSGVGISNNAGFSVINNMDVGISPGSRSSVTGFPPAVIIGGALYAADDIAPPGTPAMLAQAKLDLTAAYLFAEGATAPAPVTIAGDQGGKTLAPGIYKSTSTLLIQAGNLTLDGMGNPDATWIFQVASAFTTVGGAGGSVILTGGAQAKNIFWQTGSSAIIGDYTAFYGNILALQSITMNSHATITGRLLARNGSVVMTDTNIINKP